MRELMAGTFTERRSRFHAHLYGIHSAVEVQEIITLHRKLYRKAVHHCWALRIRTDSGVTTDHQDDGEVGHPGRVLAELLERYSLHSHVLMVSRVFGGVKLGVGGVSRAFRQAGEHTIEAWISRERNRQE